MGGYIARSYLDLKTRNKEVLSFHLNSKSYFTDGLVKPKSCVTCQDVSSGALNGCNLKDRYFSSLSLHRICKTYNSGKSFIDWEGKKEGNHSKKTSKVKWQSKKQVGMREREQWEWKDIREGKLYIKKQGWIEEGGNGEEVLAEKEEGRWKQTEKDSRVSGTWKEKRKMKEEGE